MFSWRSNYERWDDKRGTNGKSIQNLVENAEGNRPLRGTGVVKNNIKIVLTLGGNLLTGFNWLRTEFICGVLWTLQ